MTIYATGNPVGSTSPKDVIDNAQNLDLFSVGDAYEYTDRLGRPCKSMKYLQDMALAAPAIDAAIRSGQQADRSQAEADRAESNANLAAAASHPFPSTAEGIANTSGSGATNRFFSVPAVGDTLATLYRNDGGSPVVIGSVPNTSLDMLGMNAGKNYPLKIAIRNGVTSAAPVLFVNGILDIQLKGVPAGKYARLSYYGNGTTAFGAPNYGMNIDLFDAAVYPTASVAVPITTYQDTNFTEVTSSGVTTRTYQKTRVDGVGISITYRQGVFTPTVGTPVFTDSAVTAGYSWIIDPACYAPDVPLKETGLTLNADKSFPMKSATRGNGSGGVVTSTEQNLFRLGVLDIKVSGVPAGYFTRLAFYGNGTTALGGGPNYGMEFELLDVTTFGTTGAATKLTLFSDASFEEAAVSGTIVTRTYRITAREGLAIAITYDKAVFAPTVGTSVSAGFSSNAGYSWIIDPACYVPISPVSGGTPPGALVYSNTDTETLIAWRFSDTHDIRLGIGRYGVNLVNDIGAISFKAHGGGALTLGGTWSVQTPRGTDWLGPYIVNADSGGSGSTIEFTGGNHGYSGAGGAPTSALVFREVYANGRRLANGDTGFANDLTFRWRNSTQGSNTRDIPRDVLQETYVLDLTPGSIEVSVEIEALEAITFKRYHGIQSYLAAYMGTLHFLNGSLQARETYADGRNSGAKSVAPNAWCSTVEGGSYGFNLFAWVDRSYGLGLPSNLAATAPLWKTASSKLYNHFIEDAQPLSLAAGARLNWRGGYAFTPDIATGDFGAWYRDGGKQKVVSAQVAAGDNSVSLSAKGVSGKALTRTDGAATVASRATPNGLRFTATGYDVSSAVVA